MRLQRRSAAGYEYLKNKNVLVAGGDSGLGFAVTEAFVMGGSKVVITGRNR